MFWQRKRSVESPQIGCFGKLPATGDFVRMNAGSDELASFDRWFGTGMDFAQRVLGASFEEAYWTSVGLFIYRGDDRSPDPARGLVGAWAASCDRAGRLYPMMVFASYDYAQLLATGGALPIALWPLLRAAYEAAVAARELSVDAFVARVSSIPLPSLEDSGLAAAGYRSWLATQPMRALWDNGFGTDAVRYWVMHNLAASLGPFQSQELPRTALALRLPLGAGDAYAASVWIDIAMRLGCWQKTLINAFWTPQKTLLIHAGQPHPASLREMIAFSGQADHVADVCHVPHHDVASTRQVLGAHVDSLVASTEVSIAAFLDGLKGA